MTDITPEDSVIEPVNVYKEIGEELKAAREAQGKTIEALASRLKVRPRNLVAIEAGECDDLPEHAYLVGYVKAYADALGLNSSDIIARFKGAEANERKNLSLPQPHRTSFHPGFWVMVMSIIVAIGIYLLWYQHQSKEPVVEEVPTTTETAPSTPAETSATEETTTTPAQQDNAQAETSAPSAFSRFSEEKIREKNLTDLKNTRIVLLAKEATWVRLLTGRNQFLLERTMNPGDTYFVPNRSDLVITAGNPGAVEIFIDGVKDGFLGTLDDVMKQGTAAPAEADADSEDAVPATDTTTAPATDATAPATTEPENPRKPRVRKPVQEENGLPWRQ